MPIKDLTDVVRLPRLGKIHLGTKHPEKGYPMKADHFIFPKDHSDYEKLIKLFGEAPKELRILIPVEDEETWASQYYKAYNQTHGLICKGDGEVAMRMVDIKTGELPVKTTETVKMGEIPCAGSKCAVYQNREKGKSQCHEVMNFRFIIPEIPGLGVWQIDTGSKNSIMNINSCAKLIKRAFGRIAMIPLKLTFEPIEVNTLETGKKQTVYVLNLRTDVTIAQLASLAKEQVKMLTVGDLESAWEMEVEKDIDELWEDGKPAIKKDAPPIESKQPPDVPKSNSTPPAEESNTPPPTTETKTEGKENKSGSLDAELKETLKIIGWSESDALHWIAANLKMPLKKTLKEAVVALPAEKLQTFTKKLQDMREAAG